MFELKRISLHNWYLVDALDIPIREHAALIGQTGAGKSSVLDAIQTVISGNNRNVLELNAAAGAQRGRSVRDYALGCVSDVNEGKPRRDRCETTLALTFHDRELNCHIVLGLLLKAEQDLSEQTRRFIVDGCDFRIEDFVEKGAVVPHEEMIERIRKAHGEKSVSFHQNSTRFVNAYLGMMRPSAPPDAKRFLRSFANALQAREMSDPTDFVRRFVLEPMPLDVAGVRSSIAVWREMSAEVERIEGMSSDLSTVTSRYARGFQIKALEGELDVASFALDEAEAEVELQKLRSELSAKQAEVKAISSELEDRRFEEADLAGERDGLAQRLRDTDGSAELASLDAERRMLEERKASLRHRIETGLQPFSEVRHLKTIPTARQIAEAGQKLTALVAGKSPEEWLSRAEEISEFSSSVRSQAGVVDAISEDIEAKREAAHRIRAHLRDHDVEEEDARPAEVLSRHVRAFMSDLEASGIGARCLPDLVTVTDESWAFALEAILGANREAVIVDEAQIEDAFDLLYRNRNAYDGVRLIDQRHLKSRRGGLPENSLAEVVTSDDPVIRDFLNFSVGRYSRAESEAELRASSSGIMRNGKTGSGATLRVFRDRRPILGKTAQKAAQGELALEIAELRDELENLQTAIRDLEAAQHRLRSVMATDPEDILKSLAGLREVMAELRSLGQRRQAFSAPETTGLDERIAEIGHRIKTLKSALADLERRERALEVECGILKSKLEEGQDRALEFSNRRAALEQEARDRVPEAVAALVGDTGYDVPVTAEEIAEIGRMAASEAEGKIAVYRERIADLRAEITRDGSASQFLTRGNNGLMSYAQKWGVEDAPLGEDSQDADRFLWARTQFDRLQNHELLRYRDRLEKARAEMETSLTEGLIGRIGEQFSLMEEQLDSLNRRLGKYAFVGQTYQFRSTVSAQFLPIYRLVTTDVPADGSVLDVADDESLAALDALLEGDGDDVRRYEDYRNYFNFELFIEHPDPDDAGRIVSTPFSSVMGKLSGGQRQAPYYVAIAASLVSAYYPKATAGDFEGMGLMVFDEAFNKLDIPNTQRLMDLFRSLGLQVIVAAPEEKRSSLIECVDSVISVSRIPGSSDVFIDSVSIGKKARERMYAENPVHRPVEAFEAVAGE
ncbi:SbcC/MukB-like Walker B domain-containing protein [Roseivivax sp. CAU 1761]